MIWSVVTKDEMQNCKTSPVFGFYREALGKENISIAVVDDDDPLGFVGSGDIVLLRTSNEKLISTIAEKNISSTAESYETYVLVKDKKILAGYLDKYSVKMPCQFSIKEVEDGMVYFVKPRYGSDSIGITTQCICRSKDEVLGQVALLQKELQQDVVIEEFIDGIDVTVSCCCTYNRKKGYIDKEMLSAAIKIECCETNGIQTRDCKVGFKEYCSPLQGEQDTKARSIAKFIFFVLGLKHHARMDFRLGNDGELYLIDINLLPGLGPIDHFAKSFLLCHNYSYRDTVKIIVNSAS